MNTITRAFLRFMLWQMHFEHTVGLATGMNPRHLAALRQDITRVEGDLHRLEVRHA